MHDFFIKKWEDKMKKIFRDGKAKIFFITLIILVCCLLFQWKHQQKNSFLDKQIINNPIELLNRLSEKEKETLKFFFYAAFWESYAYVLLGDKPMSICHYPKLEIYKNGKIMPFYEIGHSIYYTYHPRSKKIKKGWKVFKRYIPSLLSSNFLVKKENNYILFINKKNFIKTISLNLEDFQSVLGNTITPENIYQRCQKGENLYKSILKGHEGLFGTLLGFGRNNAWTYHERDGLRKEIENGNYSPEVLKKKKEEYKKINDKLACFCEIDAPFYLEKEEDFSSHEILDIYGKYFPNSLSLPEFVCDKEDPETLHLTQTYESNKNYIIQYYIDNNFLTGTLKALGKR